MSQHKAVQSAMPPSHPHTHPYIEILHPMRHRHSFLARVQFLAVHWAAKRVPNKPFLLHRKYGVKGLLFRRTPMPIWENIWSKRMIRISEEYQWPQWQSILHRLCRVDDALHIAAEDAAAANRDNLYPRTDLIEGAHAYACERAAVSYLFFS